MTANEVLVSIAINNYNYADFLDVAIESALNQSYRSIEVIVIDDGSTDDSKRIIHRYGRSIKAVFKPNGGQASSLNTGLNVSRGDIILFLDADDYLFPHTVEQIVKHWHSSLAKVQYRLTVVDAQGKSTGRLYPQPKQMFSSHKSLKNLLYKGRYTTSVTSGNAFNRKVLEAVFPIPEAEFRIAADGYLNTIVPLYGEILSIEQPLGAYRLHGKNLWSSPFRLPTIERLERVILHDFKRYDALEYHAHKLGYCLDHCCLLNDDQHLKAKLMARQLDPTHPLIQSDRRSILLLKIIQAGLWYSERRIWYKLSLTVSLLLTYFLPMGLFKRLILRDID